MCVCAEIGGDGNREIEGDGTKAEKGHLLLSAFIFDVALHDHHHDTLRTNARTHTRQRYNVVAGVLFDVKAHDQHHVSLLLSNAFCMILYT